MEIPESLVFNGIEPLELRYFNNNKREVPMVCKVALYTIRNEHVVPLASHMKIHAYINGNMESRQKYIESIKGFTILKINNRGIALISSMADEKSLTDPIAGKLVSNMVEDLIGETNK
jgi:beta-galactosidase